MNMCKSGHEMEEQGQPVSLISQALSSPLMSLYVHVVLEFEEPIAEISRYTKALSDASLQRNPLFSSILKEDARGVLRWQKTTVNIDNHTFSPEFPPGEESYDTWVDDYIAKLSLKPFDQSRPLWEVHFLNYRTSKAGATMVLRVHHALGDGISFMSVLFAIATKADNPALPPTFPAAKRRTKPSRPGIGLSKFFRRIWHVMLVIWYTTVDVISSALRMTGSINDSKLPIRGPPGVEYMPLALSSALFQLEDIKEIKKSIGGTVNDVITGIIFYGMQRYLQISLSAVHGEQSLQDAFEKRLEMPKDAVIKQMKKSKLTALCLINMRSIAGLETIEDMLKPKSQVPWGNHFGFLPLRVPTAGKLDHPLEFVRRAKRDLDRHKISLGVFINAKIMTWLSRFKGPQAIARSLYNTMANTTMGITNMIGPTEEIAIGGSPVKSFYYFASGAPQALGVSIVSYKGGVVLQVHAQKAYVDAKMLCKCFIEAFEEIKKGS